MTLKHFFDDKNKLSTDYSPSRPQVSITIHLLDQFLWFLWVHQMIIQLSIHEERKVQNASIAFIQSYPPVNIKTFIYLIIYARIFNTLTSKFYPTGNPVICHPTCPPDLWTVIWNWPKSTQINHFHITSTKKDLVASQLPIDSIRFCPLHELVQLAW